MKRFLIKLIIGGLFFTIFGVAATSLVEYKVAKIINQEINSREAEIQSRADELLEEKVQEILADPEKREQFSHLIREALENQESRVWFNRMISCEIDANGEVYLERILKKRFPPGHPILELLRIPPIPPTPSSSVAADSNTRGG